ncbi:bifunctional hydroxymethylpyrimidine kinase/phosphomethylpyrimidine kinase [Granulicella tundricola]|uniref:hydroxymethylpyrimidine kinase n=1 Tax=Granulicella tundricola (strain ATCC BAA-1859 / DSM 23138 / MP5ACTX9) TaxID=1198114 RepID=E8X2L2_GRATM|nr:bifunctional hydroxymethylpyrimidine kinase/phosphomethylpyrimidine kinase [Granulicella tundricola]ADW69236.1 phosphomethylpyrimidine kinase [Granulicella tundricola MP5ACTX9]
MKTGLTIAGFDPSSGAGVTADLAVMGALGVFGTSCITALTVQSTLGVRATHPVPPEVVASTLDCLAVDLPAAGIKIGMLATAATVEVVLEFLRGIGEGVPVVLDPVMRSSSGRALLDAPGVEAMRERLLPLVDWVTPNLGELEVLVGRELDTKEEMEVAALELGERWPGLNVVATGGDLDVPDDLVVTADGAAVWVPGVWIESTATHGTGCAFSTALMCGLVSGLEAVEAVRNAKQFVAGAIRRAEVRGGGKGPMELLWPLRTQRAR